MNNKIDENSDQKTQQIYIGKNSFYYIKLIKLL